jgi:hypothetical protein
VTERSKRARPVKLWCLVEGGKLLPLMVYNRKEALVRLVVGKPNRRIARVELREVPAKRKPKAKGK